MVGACQQNSGIFLVRGGEAEQEICGGWRRARSEMPVGRNRVAAGRDGSGQMLGRGRRREVPRLGSAVGGRDAGRCRGWAGSGTSRDRSDMPAGAEAGQAAEPPGTGRDAGGGRGWAGSGTSKDRVGGNQINSK